MAYTIQEIATQMAMTAVGDASITVEALAEPQDATRDHLAMAMKPEYADALGQGSARAAVLWDGADWQALGLEAAILAPRPRFAMSGLTRMMDPGQGWGRGVHPAANPGCALENLNPDACFLTDGRGI